MMTLESDVPLSLRYFQQETGKIYKNTSLLLPEVERNRLNLCIATLVHSAKARGSNPDNQLFIDDRTITGVNMREWFINQHNPAKGAFRKYILPLTASVSDKSLETLWSVLEMLQEKNRNRIAESIIVLVEKAYAWGSIGEPHADPETILAELSTW